MKYNYNRCDVYGVNLNGYFDWTCGRTAFGAELRNEDLVSTNLGEPLLQTHHINGTDLYYVLGINRTNMSAHLEHNILLDRLTISAGFVAMKSTQSAMNWQMYPGVDASYRFNDHWKVYASCNTSMRLPSFTEMYYKLQGYAADPHLKPEEMLALEVGTRYLSAAVQAKVSAFHHRGKDMIDWIMDTSIGEQAEWQSVNHTRLSSYGVEAGFMLDLQRLMPWQNGLRRFGVSYVYMYQDKKKEPNIVSQYALEYLRHKLLITSDLRICKKMSVGLYGRWQDRVGSYTSLQNKVKPYRPFFLLDARLTWTMPDYSLYAKLNNVLNNRNYVDYGCVPQPGIWITMGGEWHF
jgi:iron complex outermembrane receptor protein